MSLLSSSTRGHRGLIATVTAALCLMAASTQPGVAATALDPAPLVPAITVHDPVPLVPAVSGASDPPARLVAAPDDPWSRWDQGVRRADDAPTATATGPALERSRPIRVEMPSIGVDSVVQDLGQTTEGALEVPARGPHYNEAAWYRHSPTPGELGPAIMLGHVDSAAEGPSVFFRLGELQVGDAISVTRADGSTAVFAVDEVQRFPKDEFPTDLVYGDIDHAGLRVLTCGGSFDRASGHYLDNIVVFASLVTSEHPPGQRPAGHPRTV